MDRATTPEVILIIDDSDVDVRAVREGVDAMKAT